MFALNGNPENPCCVGIDGVIEAYKSAVKAVQLSQPTCVAQLINHVAEQAMQHDSNTQVNELNDQGQNLTLLLRHIYYSTSILITIVVIQISDVL